MSCKILLEQRVYIERQITLACSAENRYYTAQEVEHDPNPDECLMHWVQCGGADWFRSQYGIKEEEDVAQQH